jgi:hypothetical protein
VKRGEKQAARHAAAAGEESAQDGEIRTAGPHAGRENRGARRSCMAQASDTQTAQPLPGAKQPSAKIKENAGGSTLPCWPGKTRT